MADIIFKNGNILTLEDNNPKADGLVKASAGDLKGAEESFAKALELDGFRARAHWELAKVLKRRNKERDARTHQERALELEPRVYSQ